jgi:hypothetical protein
LQKLKLLILRYFLTLWFSFFCGVFFAQTDSVYLMSGKIIAVKIDSVNKEFLFGNKQGKPLKLNNDRIYGYAINNEKRYLYPDRSIDFLSIPQMGEIILGKRLAHKNYSTTGQIIAGFTLGLLGSLYDTYNPDNKKLFHGEPTYGHFIAPLVYTLSINVFRPKLTAKKTPNPDYLYNELIIEGYVGEARRKKFLATAISSMSGSAVGLATYFIFKP